MQGLRKEAGLNVVDRIELEIVVEKNLKSSFETYKDYIKAETLAQKLSFQDLEEKISLKNIQSCEIEGLSCVVALEKIS